MRHGVPYVPLTPPPSFLPYPSPVPPPPARLDHDNSVLLSVLLAFILPCIGMSAVFLIYMFLLWFSTANPTASNLVLGSAVEPAGRKGLSELELENLPKVTGKEMGTGKSRECAVCLEEIEGEQPVRLVPVCSHGFHLECADTWLSKRPVCPVCRAQVGVGGGGGGGGPSPSHVSVSAQNP